jgi:hypothetical protein
MVTAVPVVDGSGAEKIDTCPALLAWALVSTIAPPPMTVKAIDSDKTAPRRIAASQVQPASVLS